VFVLYDSECGFCRWSVVQVVRRAPSLLPVAIQSAEGQRLLRSLAPDQRLASAHTVGYGYVRSGGAAVIDVLGEMTRARFPYKAARATPGLMRMSYNLLAGRRALLGKLISAAAIGRADEYLAAARSASDRRSASASPRRP
jgi:predicted DCC family thiol-disulfide oxidoreductase YuxK